MLEADMEVQRDVARAALVEQIRRRLTQKQYRRLCLYYLEGMTESEIAAREGVSQQAVSLCIQTAKNILNYQRYFLKALVLSCVVVYLDGKTLVNTGFFPFTLELCLL